MQFGVFRGTAITSASAQEFQCTGMTEDPTFAVIWVTNATAEDTTTDHAVLAMGFAWESSAAGAGATISERDASAISETRTTSSASSTIRVIDPTTGTVVAVGNGYVNGQNVGIEWIDAPPVGYAIQGFAFGSTDSIYVESFLVPEDETNTYTMNGGGFEPDLALFLSPSENFAEDISNVGRFSFGIAANVSGVFEQGCFAYVSADGQTKPALGAAGRDDCISMKIFGSSIQGQWSAEPDSGGVVITTDVGNNHTHKMLAALIKFNNPPEHTVQWISEPSTGGTSVSVGFEANTFIALATRLTGAIPTSSITTETNFSLGAANNLEAVSVTYQSQDDVNDSNTSVRMNSSDLYRSPDHSGIGVDDAAGGVTSIGSTAFTLTATEAATSAVKILLYSYKSEPLSEGLEVTPAGIVNSSIQGDAPTVSQNVLPLPLFNASVDADAPLVGPTVSPVSLTNASIQGNAPTLNLNVDAPAATSTSIQGAITVGVNVTLPASIGMSTQGAAPVVAMNAAPAGIVNSSIQGDAPSTLEGAALQGIVNSSVLGAAPAVSLAVSPPALTNVSVQGGITAVEDAVLQPIIPGAAAPDLSDTALFPRTSRGSGYWADAPAVANLHVFDREILTSDFIIGVLVIHEQEVAEVRIGCHQTNLANWASCTFMENPNTGEQEWCARIRVSDYTPGVYRFDAYIRMATGQDTYTDSVVFRVDPENSFRSGLAYADVYVDSEGGSDSNAAPTSSTPFKHPKQALRFAQLANGGFADGVVVHARVRATGYYWNANETQNYDIPCQDTWATVESWDPGAADPLNPPTRAFFNDYRPEVFSGSSGSHGMWTKLIKFRNVECRRHTHPINGISSSGYQPGYAAAQSAGVRIYCDNCLWDGLPNGPTSGRNSGEAFLSTRFERLYLRNTTIRGFGRASYRIFRALDVQIEDIGDDVWREPYPNATIVRVTGLNLFDDTPSGTGTFEHSDWIQWSANPCINLIAMKHYVTIPDHPGVAGGSAFLRMSTGAGQVIDGLALVAIFFRPGVISSNSSSVQPLGSYARSVYFWHVEVVGQNLSTFTGGQTWDFVSIRNSVFMGNFGLAGGANHVQDNNHRAVGAFGVSGTSGPSGFQQEDAFTSLMDPYIEDVTAFEHRPTVDGPLHGPQRPTPPRKLIAKDALGVAWDGIPSIGALEIERAGGPGVLTPASIPADESYGVPTLSGTSVLSPESIPADETYGVPVLLGTGILVPESIPADETYGVPTIQTDALIPGSGWAGATPTPSPIGPTTEPWYTETSIAKWTFFDRQIESGEFFHVGVVAFHGGDIERVEIGCEGNWVQATEMTFNPDSRMWDYNTRIRVYDYPGSRNYEFRAIAYPVVGQPYVLPSRLLFVDADVQQGAVQVFVDPGQSIHAALQAAAADNGGLADLVEVVCRQGTHNYVGGARVATAETYAKIVADPTAPPGSVVINNWGTGLNAAYLMIEGIHIPSTSPQAVIRSASSGDVVFLNRNTFNGSGPGIAADGVSNGSATPVEYATFGRIWSRRNTYSNMKRSIFRCEASISDLHFGIGGDIYREVGFIANWRVRDSWVTGNFESNDIFQWVQAGSTSNVDQVVIYNGIAERVGTIGGVQFFIADSVAAHANYEFRNVAMVNNVMFQNSGFDGPKRAKFKVPGRHFLMWHNSFLNHWMEWTPHRQDEVGSGEPWFPFDGNYKKMLKGSVRNNVFHRFTYHDTSTPTGTWTYENAAAGDWDTVGAGPRPEWDPYGDFDHNHLLLSTSSSYSEAAGPDGIYDPSTNPTSTTSHTGTSATAMTMQTYNQLVIDVEGEDYRPRLDGWLGGTFRAAQMITSPKRVVPADVFHARRGSIPNVGAVEGVTNLFPESIPSDETYGVPTLQAGQATFSTTNQVNSSVFIGVLMSAPVQISLFVELNQSSLPGGVLFSPPLRPASIPADEIYGVPTLQSVALNDIPGIVNQSTIGQVEAQQDASITLGLYLNQSLPLLPNSVATVGALLLQLQVNQSSVVATPTPTISAAIVLGLPARNVSSQVLGTQLFLEPGPTATQYTLERVRNLSTMFDPGISAATVALSIPRFVNTSQAIVKFLAWQVGGSTMADYYGVGFPIVNSQGFMQRGLSAVHQTFFNSWKVPAGITGDDHTVAMFQLEPGMKILTTHLEWDDLASAGTVGVTVGTRVVGGALTANSLITTQTGAAVGRVAVLANVDVNPTSQVEVVVSLDGATATYIAGAQIRIMLTCVALDTI